MSRRVRMILLALFGPAALTVAFAAVVFGALYLIGLRYSRDQIEVGMLFFLLFWQAVAIWWLWRNWR